MKDDQITPAGSEPRIFFVSAALHCVAMTALVYVRSSFGFGFLRPKSVFFAFTWAFILYAIYAWIDDGVWQEHRAVLWFGIGAAILYWFQVLLVVIREWQGKGKHDQDSGTVLPVRLMRLMGKSTSSLFDERCRLWAEPSLAVATALVLRLNVGDRYLSRWLYFVAFCLWTKEALNQWFRLRRRKRRGDILEDAEDAFAGGNLGNPSTAELTVASARKSRIKRSRAIVTTGTEDERSQRYAEILKLLPPYELVLAERNYRAFILEEHPDTNADSDESTGRTRELNEAIGYFRRQLTE